MSAAASRSRSSSSGTRDARCCASPGPGRRWTPCSTTSASCHCRRTSRPRAGGWTGRARGRRSRALSDGVRDQPRRRGGADRRLALHGAAARGDRRRGPRGRARSPSTSARGPSGPWRPTIRARTGWMPSATGSRPRRRTRLHARGAERRPVVAVGTTVVRSLEASARANGGAVVAGDAVTDLCLLPGDRFQVVTDLITNFHLPRSTLLMLVAAFAGTETRPRRLPRSGRAGLPLLQLRRRDADPGHA